MHEELLRWSDLNWWTWGQLPWVYLLAFANRWCLLPGSSCSSWMGESGSAKTTLLSVGFGCPCRQLRHGHNAQLFGHKALEGELLTLIYSSHHYFVPSAYSEAMKNWTEVRQLWLRAWSLARSAYLLLTSCLALLLPGICIAKKTNPHSELLSHWSKFLHTMNLWT